jgi:hypothetical protein
MDIKQREKCWSFVMSSFTRTYGVKRVMNEEKFHEIALFWCDVNAIDKYKILEEYDAYFKKLYEEWK